jgi:hypothetical protein
MYLKALQAAARCKQAIGQPVLCSQVAVTGRRLMQHAPHWPLCRQQQAVRHEIGLKRTRTSSPGRRRVTMGKSPVTGSGVPAAVLAGMCLAGYYTVLAG